MTAQPVKYLVYSHSAFDHSTGGAVFADTARFVGHRNVVERIKAAKDPTTPAPATDDYIVVHYPAGRLAMFVDLVQPRNIPFRTLLGHPERIVERFQWIEETLDFDVIVSGHATPQMSGTKQDIVDRFSRRAKERTLRHLLQQCPGFSEVAGVKSLGEPFVHLG